MLSKIFGSNFYKEEPCNKLQRSNSPQCKTFCVYSNRLFRVDICLYWLNHLQAIASLFDNIYLFNVDTCIVHHRDNKPREHGLENLHKELFLAVPNIQFGWWLARSLASMFGCSRKCMQYADIVTIKSIIADGFELAAGEVLILNLKSVTELTKTLC